MARSRCPVGERPTDDEQGLPFQALIVQLAGQLTTIELKAIVGGHPQGFVAILQAELRIELQRNEIKVFVEACTVAPMGLVHIGGTAVFVACLREPEPQTGFDRQTVFTSQQGVPQGNRNRTLVASGLGHQPVEAVGIGVVFNKGKISFRPGGGLVNERGSPVAGRQQHHVGGNELVGGAPSGRRRVSMDPFFFLGRFEVESVQGIRRESCREIVRMVVPILVSQECGVLVLRGRPPVEIRTDA